MLEKIRCWLRDRCIYKELYDAIEKEKKFIEHCLISNKQEEILKELDLLKEEVDEALKDYNENQDTFSVIGFKIYIYSKILELRSRFCDSCRLSKKN